MLGYSSTTGLACCHRWLPAPPLLLLRQSAPDCRRRLLLVAATSDLYAQLSQDVKGVEAITMRPKHGMPISFRLR